MVEQDTTASLPAQRSMIRPLTKKKKTALGELWGALKKSEQHSGTKKHEKNCTKKKEEQLYFACIVPSPKQAILEPRGHFPARKGPPHPTSLSPVQRTAKLRPVDTAKYKEEKQRLSLSISQAAGITSSQGPALQKTVAVFITADTNRQHTHLRHPQI